MFHFAPHSTLNTSTSSLSPTVLCYSRLLLRTQTCCPRIHLSTVKIHGGMVLLRDTPPPQVMSPTGSSSTGFWSSHKINSLTTRMTLKKWVSKKVFLQPISLRFGREHCDAARLGPRRRAIASDAVLTTEITGMKRK